MTNELYHKILDVVPLIISAVSLRVLRVRGKYWQKKITAHISPYKFTSNQVDKIISVIEDIYASLSFIVEALLISIGSLILVVKEYHHGTNLCSITISRVFFVIMFVGCLVALKNLFSMEKTLLDEKIVSHVFRKVTYKKAYDGFLTFGYCALAIIGIVPDIIAELLK